LEAGKALEGKEHALGGGYHSEFSRRLQASLTGKLLGFLGLLDETA
jgi:hypothetical protein